MYFVKLFIIQLLVMNLRHKWNKKKWNSRWNDFIKASRTIERINKNFKVFSKFKLAKSSAKAFLLIKLQFEWWSAHGNLDLEL